MSRKALAFAALLLSASIANAQTLQVRVEGEVTRPGVQTHAADTRLAEAVIAAAPTDTAYPIAAMLMRRPAEQAQRRLKAGLMHDLGVLESSDDREVAAVARDLADWIDRLPVTGRVRTELSPRRLESTPAANLPLIDGDRVHYPARPGEVRVVGAVVEPCTIPHVALQDALAYTTDCSLRTASRDWMFVIQPDGAVQRLGIAMWNRSETQALAPGAVVYVPLPDRATRRLDGDFNAELAEFLATQPLDEHLTTSAGEARR
ncbi:MAG: capsule biosynthesis GfcC family protein [Luteimonas sp.]